MYWKPFSYYEGETHIMPSDEEGDHMFDVVCPCGIKDDTDSDGHRFITHSSFDGREAIMMLQEHLLSVGIFKSYAVEDIQYFLDSDCVLSSILEDVIGFKGMKSLVVLIDLSKTTKEDIDTFASIAIRIPLLYMETRTINEFKE